MQTDYLFLAEVKSINYLYSPNKKKATGFLGYDYTINVATTLEPDVIINNVRVITPNLGGINSESGGSYTFNPPAIGDFVVCGYLHNDHQSPVALGVIANTDRNKMPIGLLKGEGTYLLYHESGTWLRIRNIKNEWKNNFANAGQNITSKSNESEFVLHHKDGHEFTITKETIVINSNKGSKIFIEEKEKSSTVSINNSKDSKIVIESKSKGKDEGESEDTVTISHVKGQSIIMNKDEEILIGKEPYEPIIKGQKFLEWLGQFKNALGSCFVMTALGPSGPLQACPGWAQIETLFIQLQNDLSAKGNLYFSKRNKVS